MSMTMLDDPQVDAFQDTQSKPFDPNVPVHAETS